MTELKILVQRWLDMYQGDRFEDWTDIVDADFVLRFPFAPPGVPDALPALVARDALKGARAGQDRFEWLDVAMFVTEDPDLLVTTARSEADLKPTGTYANRYVMFTRSRRGKLVEHIEYFDPLPVLAMRQQ